VAGHGGRRVYKSATLQIRRIQVGPLANQSARRAEGPGALSARGAALNTFGLGRYLIQGARPAIHNSRRGLWDNKERERASAGWATNRSDSFSWARKMYCNCCFVLKGWCWCAHCLPRLCYGLAGCGRVINAHHIPPCAPAKTRCQQLLVREELLVGGKTNPTLEIINYFARQPNIKSRAAAASICICTDGTPFALCERCIDANAESEREDATFLRAHDKWNYLLHSYIV
jgi:hypothetical protein